MAALQPAAGHQDSKTLLYPAYRCPYSGHRRTLDNMLAKKYEPIPPCFSVIVPYSELLIIIFPSTITGLRCTHLLTEFGKPGVCVRICLLLLFGIKWCY